MTSKILYAIRHDGHGDLLNGFDHAYLKDDLADAKPLTDFDWAGLVEEITAEEAAEYAADEEGTYDFDSPDYSTVTDAEAGGLYAKAQDRVAKIWPDSEKTREELFDRVYSEVLEEDADDKAEQKKRFLKARDDAYTEGPAWLADEKSDGPESEDDLLAFCREYGWDLVKFEK